MVCRRPIYWAEADTRSDAGDDVATSELPAFLSGTLGASAAALGVIDGISDALVACGALRRRACRCVGSLHQRKRCFCWVTSSAVISPESASLASSDCARLASSRNSVAISVTASFAGRCVDFGATWLGTLAR
jgi:hypothetical protein